MPLDFTDGFSFGSYTYGDNLEAFRDSPIAENIAAESSSYPGSHAGNGRLIRRQLELRGTIVAPSHQRLRDAIDEFLYAHSPGYPKKLITYSDRYLWAQVDGELTREHTNARQWPWTAVMRCADPYYYSVAPTVVTLTEASLGDFTTTRTAILTSPGTAFATPVISIVIDDYTDGLVSIENATTDELFSFTPTANGTYLLHCGPNCTDDEPTNRSLRHRLTKAGVDFTSTATELDLITLAVGPNEIKITGAGISSVTFSWHGRYI